MTEPIAMSRADLDSIGRRSSGVAWLGLTAMLVAAADQASKYLVIEVLRLAELGRVWIAPIVDLVMVWNRGVSYGLMANADPWVPIATAAVAIAVAAFLASVALAARRRLMLVALGVIVGGALGNQIDRLRFGAVADFIHLSAYGVQSSVFNVADVAIVIGVALLAIDQYFVAGSAYLPAAQRVAGAARPWFRP
jgi:signal peptidase II